MEQTIIDIKSSDGLLEAPLDPQIIKDAIFVDSSDYSAVSYITLSGKYNRTYKIVAGCSPVNHDRVLVEDNFLIICLLSNILVIDLNADRLVKNIDINWMDMFRIFKFKSGYFICGESFNRFMNKEFDIVWKCGCIDIFVNPKIKNELEIFDDYITVFDWRGYKHFYNEKGEFKTEHYPEYDMK